jgi:hypothetical protein
MALLAAHAFLGLCAWSTTNEYRDAERLFRCAGCTSEWVSSEPWTPIEADGTISSELAAERSRDRS